MLGGVGVGAALERADLTSPIPESVVDPPLYEAPYYSCPGESEIGTFHSGDRVFITGKTFDESLVEVRAPFDPSVRVWVWARHAVPDRDLADVPAKACDDRRDPAGSATTTTTTTEPPTTTTTTEPPTTTTEPPTTTTEPPTTTTEPPTTTTEPPDTTGPEISAFQATEADIWEAGAPCALQPQMSTVGAVISDPSGISEVTLFWAVGGAAGAFDVPVIAAPVYGVDIGPFDTTTLGGVAQDTAFLQLVAVDGASNVSSVTSVDLVTLHDCVIR